MKKLFIAALFLNALFASAQLSVKKLDGTVINDGDVFVFNALSDPDDIENPNNYLGLKIYNTGTQNMQIKAKAVSISNATGDNLQLCIGDVCLSALTAGNSYPSSAVTIAAGGTNSNFDHLLNANPGINPALPVEYVIKIYQLNGNVEVGNSVTFTYRYSGALATTGFDALAGVGVTIKSTMVNSQLDIFTQNEVSVTLFDTNGKLVRREELTSGVQTIETASLNSGIYIVNFKNKAGQQATAKIIKN
jgi:hypothetical protein